MRPIAYQIPWPNFQKNPPAILKHGDWSPLFVEAERRPTCLPMAARLARGAEPPGRAIRPDMPLR